MSTQTQQLTDAPRIDAAWADIRARLVAKGLTEAAADAREVRVRARLSIDPDTRLLRVGLPGGQPGEYSQHGDPLRQLVADVVAGAGAADRQPPAPLTADEREAEEARRRADVDDPSHAIYGAF
jgi:hypothetical protein